ncbi:aldehyde dehydrogenase family protein, partial [Chitinimonas sp.]|uniref:aldehyde dehydrogenase family protein n=1 Tax=Chitinimonas sp. TaxID=1934313 RepID=UPI0035AED670
VRRIGQRLQQRKAALAELVCLETGQTLVEAGREVQLAIHACEHALAMAEQWHGYTAPAEAGAQRLMEQWHPLGTIGIVTPFCQPLSNWARHAMPALLCGNALVWKPSEKAPLTAIAVQRLLEQLIADMNDLVPAPIAQLTLGEAAAAQQLAEHPLIALLAATGSSRMGHDLARRCAGRLGRHLLALSCNNAAIVAPSADLDLVMDEILPGAMHAAGQHCSAPRRLIVHQTLLDPLCKRLQDALRQLAIGDPRDRKHQIGPLIDGEAYWTMQQALQAAEQQGGRCLAGGHRLELAGFDAAYYVQPALVSVPGNLPIVCQESFAPILYVMPYSELLDAIDLNNAVAQGHATTLFSDSLREAEWLLGAAGADTGVVNINHGIGWAEADCVSACNKESGNGYSGGIVAWQNYMRRVVNTVSYGKVAPATGLAY